MLNKSRVFNDHIGPGSWLARPGAQVSPLVGPGHVVVWRQGPRLQHEATNIAYPRKHSIVANENYENYRSTSGNGTIGIYHNNNNLTISKLSIDFIMIISPALLLLAKTIRKKTQKKESSYNNVE